MKRNVEQCKSVLADLEKASGADREIDILIATTIDGWALEKRGKDRKTWLYKDSGEFRYERSDPSPYGYGVYPRLTHSLDASIALVGRVLPGWARETAYWPTIGNPINRRASATLWEADSNGRIGGPLICVEAEAGTEPLALLTALFRALIAQMEKADG